MEESYPWREGPDHPPDSHCDQKMILTDEEKNAPYDLVATYPNHVIGVAKDYFIIPPLAWYLRRSVHGVPRQTSVSQKREF